MASLKKKTLHNNGFTIIELLIVVIVIGILTFLVAWTYGDIKAKARNSERETDIQKTQRQLEAFFSQNGYYPSLADVNNASWLKVNMKGFDQAALIDPSSPNHSKTLAATPTAHAYSYHVTDSSGNSCENTDTNCAKYTLTAKYEGTVNGKSEYAKSNLD